MADPKGSAASKALTLSGEESQHGPLQGAGQRQMTEGALNAW